MAVSPEELPAEDRAALKSLRDAFEALKASPPPPIPLALAAQEGGVPRSAHEGIHDARIHVRGNYQRLGESVPRHFPRIVAGDEQPPITQGSGRLELARWIASPDHPLTARVMVNRLWQHHFGEGIVRTPSNFGKLGKPPTHPELLDFLARRFVASGWSIKAMHRAIMLSAAYQQSSHPTAESLRLDPENRLFGRMNRRRLEAEAIRDGLLAVAGRLDPAMGGPSYPRLQRPPTHALPDDDPLRSLVLRPPLRRRRRRRDRRPPHHLDRRAAVALPAEQPVRLEHARALAARIKAEAPEGDDARIDRAYRLLYGRAPEADEVAIGLRRPGEICARRATTSVPGRRIARSCSARTSSFTSIESATGARPMFASHSRRQMLRQFANGFGMLGLAGLLADEAKADATALGNSTSNPLAVKPPHFPARAKRVIFLFMSGGPSHVDTFDPKPRLAHDNGKPLPFAMPHLERTRTGNLLQSPFKFAKSRPGRDRGQRAVPEGRRRASTTSA